MTYRFNPPPGWQVPPGFTPGEGWQADRTWPPAPPDWVFWVEEVAEWPDTPEGPAAYGSVPERWGADARPPSHRQGRNSVIRGGIFLVLALVFLAVRIADGGWGVTNYLLVLAGLCWTGYGVYVMRDAKRIQDRPVS